MTECSVNGETDRLGRGGKGVQREEWIDDTDIRLA